MVGLKGDMKWSLTYLLIPVDGWFLHYTLDICHYIPPYQTCFRPSSELGVKPSVSIMSIRAPSVEAAGQRIFHSMTGSLNKRGLHFTRRIVSMVGMRFHETDTKLMRHNHGHQ